ncbi:apolipoprotein N-acyltransferase [Conservatibacter flavescens]|uniref:Apolipoprotein N-acyltransferase n=1 Tax=Conservatibacter flavescens TaxID=28161 RepID=A0A2M8S027_9PAST|nr:apolipoprotein N-acyltransferase [Conservatibacter flavescens]PJG84497.1 apolipoprotein N-acyltransferase [Conservatibacter flavescens]
MGKIFYYLTALFSGGIGFLAFSPFDLWGVAYLSLIGLLIVVKNPHKKTALWGAFLWGLSFFSVGVSWLNVSIHQFGGAPLIVSYLLVVLLSAYLALYPVLFAYIIQRFQIQKLAMYPVVWTFTEFLRGWVFTGFPWLQFGYTQIDSPFAGLAPFFGVTGLTFFVVWSSAVILNSLSAIFKGPRWNIVIANLCMLLVVGSVSVYAGKQHFVKEVPEKALTITLAQGNIEQNLKWDPDYLQRTLDIYFQQIAEHLGQSDVVILPEAALPTLENRIAPLLQDLQQAAQEKGTEIIIGTVYQDQTIARLFNSIIVLGNQEKPYGDETKNRYNKHHLVPFGEYVPLESILRPLGTVFNLPMSNFQQGDIVQSPLFSKERYFTPAICYEIIFGSQLQENIQKQTDFILTISNDAWFGHSIGPWQHLQMARMRALELGKPVIRATNTGITAFIDAKGKIIAQAPQFEQVTLTQRVMPTTGRTPYAVFGNHSIYILSLILTLFWGLGTWLKSRMVGRNHIKTTTSS